MDSFYDDQQTCLYFGDMDNIQECEDGLVDRYPTGCDDLFAESADKEESCLDTCLSEEDCDTVAVYAFSDGSFYCAFFQCEGSSEFTLQAYDDYTTYMCGYGDNPQPPDESEELSVCE